MKHNRFWGVVALVMAAGYAAVVSPAGLCAQQKDKSGGKKGAAAAPAAPAAAPAPAASVLTLDQALQEAAVRIDERVRAGSKIAPLNFNSLHDKFSSYALDELTACLVDTRKLIVVDRRELSLIADEFAFQFSGEVGDDTMQAVGRKLGAQAIISGSLTDLGDIQRIVIRVLNVENASVEVQYRANITNDKLVAALLTGGKAPVTAAAKASPKPAAASAGAGAQQAGAAQQAALKNGTYTFYPRPRGKKGGANSDGWLAKIMIRNGNMDLYLVDRPIGGGTRGGLVFGPPASLILQDLDNPSKIFTAIGSPRFDEATGAHVVPFRNVTATRFSYIETDSNPMWIIEEIILEEPDKNG